MSALADILATLDEKERIYVESRLKGMNEGASLRAAGVPMKGGVNGIKDFTSRPQIVEALRKAHALSAHETGVTRARVAEMLMEAYRNATSATEQVLASRELGKLYGLYAAEKVEMNHRVERVESASDLKSLSHEELIRLASMDKGITIDGEFTVVKPLAVERLSG